MTGRMMFATHLCLPFCLPVSPSLSLPVCVLPDGARELAERFVAANLGGEEGDAALSQSLELASERAEPARLHPRARAAEGAGGVLALDAVDDEVCDGHALFAQRLEIARALLEGHRFGTRDEDEARARRVEEHRAHARDARREVAQEEVNLVLARATNPREVRDHVAGLLRHHVERADPPREDIRQAQHARSVA